MLLRSSAGDPVRVSKWRRSRSRQAQAPAAEYRPGSRDGTKLARLWINPASPEYQRTITIERTAYHEGVPGHHMEVGIARSVGRSADPAETRYAFSEGWAIYAERLAKDVGFYSDPYSDYGRAARSSSAMSTWSPTRAFI
jgi:uncharacterized protein (DUF885 family)